MYLLYYQVSKYYTISYVEILISDKDGFRQQISYNCDQIESDNLDIERYLRKACVYKSYNDCNVSDLTRRYDVWAGIMRRLNSKIYDEYHPKEE